MLVLFGFQFSEEKDKSGSPSADVHQGASFVSLSDTRLGISCSNPPTKLKQYEEKLIIQYLISCPGNKSNNPSTSSPYSGVVSVSLFNS